MGTTKAKGDQGEAFVMADVLNRGYKVALPVGEDWRFDLIVLRDDKLERVQCKYTESDGESIKVKTRSTNNWVDIRYSALDIDWIAVYDRTTDTCYYIPSSELTEDMTEMKLRLTPPKNNQKKGIRWATDFTNF